MAQSFKATLNLPKTAFPMRASLAQREPERFAHWDKTGLYGSLQNDPERQETFILHDGPPYANGDIHAGHALNKILKDIVLRYQAMQGKRTPYVPGWDCHGLPIEQRVLRDVGDRIHEMEPVELRKLCQEYAARYLGIQRDQFKRLGILGDWDTPYATYTPAYEVGILSALHALVEKGLIRKGFKVVHWDPVFRTALAEAEIEYHEHTSDSIYVRFPLHDSANYEPVADLDNVSIVIWTTTPWTLPANLGVVLHPDLNYCAVRYGDEHFIVAEGLAESFISAAKLEGAEVVRVFKSTAFDRAVCAHPIFPDRTSLVMLGDHVTLEQGTGCVHTAPGHGVDDFNIGQQYGLEVVVPVDARGCYTSAYPQREGEFVFKANAGIVEDLKASGRLVAHGKVHHDYPYSWRSKEPIIFRATEQWFMELADGGVRKQALEAIDNAVAWIPHWGHDRIRSMVERRPEWCISRQRAWGVPIPSLRGKKSGESFLDPQVLARFIEVVRDKGTDAWFTEPLSAFVPDDFTYAPTGETGPDAFEKEFDILDVWFDSGASHVAVLEQDERLHSPADLYLEGSDQHRGWFQSALLTAIGARGRPPFKAVLTHGFILDGEGRAMSKSLGNTISPLDLIKTSGADILRFWVASVDYRNDVAMSEEILKTVADNYRTIRNTLRFQLGNLADFTPADAVPYAEMQLFDRWALAETARLVDEVSAAYRKYEFHRVYQAVNRFCAVTLSAVYHDLLKDRLYTFAAASADRRSGQTALHAIFQALTRLLAPVLVFTADEAWSFAQGEEFGNESVHTQRWPVVPAEWRDERVRHDVSALLEVRRLVNEKLAELRSAKVIGQSLDAAVTLTAGADDALGKVVLTEADALPELLIVSAVSVQTADDPAASLEVAAQHAEGVRCPRCWRWVPALVDTPSGEVCPRCAEALVSSVTT